ncbi:MAG: 5-carboxymethyl-2-hydroxymuconate Delta-isomerase, partial [Methylobacteriaceae bacterium]|nr:5-carboxymethyl-2-hydroxymuconate Delta-isomerase [Methylobacteriaceae bacterium]
VPHIIVEYSANLDGAISPRRLVNGLHAAALETGVFPLGGLRTRAERRDVFAVADGDPEHGFVAIRVRIGAGRDAATRRRVAEALMAVLETETRDAFAARGLALSVEVEEIDPAASLKRNNLHERLGAKGVVA